MSAPDPFEGKEDGVYMSQVEVSMGELREALAAAERLLAKGVFEVEVRGTMEQCEAFAEDIVAVAKMLRTLARALTTGEKLPDGPVV